MHFPVLLPMLLFSHPICSPFRVVLIRDSRFLYSSQAYKPHPFLASSTLPQNLVTDGLVSALASAHALYGPPESLTASRQTCILFIVQPNNVNTADERPLEFALQERGIPVFRVEFGPEVLERTSVAERKTRELLFHPYTASIDEEIMEVSVIYVRAGYDAEEYDDVGVKARYNLERSRAIKAPNLLACLAGLKKVQQTLTLPENLSRFVGDEDAKTIKRIHMPMYPLDADSEAGRRGRELARDPKTAVNYVLKPNLEGGGHNTYGMDIPMLLEEIPEQQWAQYVLMKLIRPPNITGTLLSSTREVYTGPVVSEVGIFGACLWRVMEGDEDELEILENRGIGFSFKTKARGENEMSVAKGFGCFDSPCLK